ncbi:unnamed protein product [Sphagnum troendelagicum]
MAGVLITEPSDEGITDIGGTPSATTAMLLCLFFSTRSKTGRMVKLEAAGQPSWYTASCKGKGQSRYPARERAAGTGR